MPFIDLNGDLGEGGPFDAGIMPFLSSCNIACGGHAGDETIIAKTVKLALANQVKIGAHPAYPDKKNFGRKPFQIKLSSLKTSLQEQIERVRRETEKQGGKLRHVKPHGALYNELMTDEEKAKTVIDAVCEIDKNLFLIVPPKSVVKKLAEKKLTTLVEGFADRNYEADFSLTSRSVPGAVLSEKEVILEQVLNMAKRKSIILKDGMILHQKFDTICLHSDTKNCLEILRYLFEVLPEHNLTVSKL